jgi:hypothetical protein
MRATRRDSGLGEFSVEGVGEGSEREGADAGALGAVKIKSLFQRLHLREARGSS